MQWDAVVEGVSVCFSTSLALGTAEQIFHIASVDTKSNEIWSSLIQINAHTDAPVHYHQQGAQFPLLRRRSR
jgi:hypothetical protein